MRNGSIRLHSKYGVNPTIPLCFWCGKERNEIALLGAAYRGEAPKNLLIDREPCDTCKANMALGITIIEATRSGGETVPTGRWLVLKQEAAEAMLRPPELVQQVLLHRRAYVEPAAFAILTRDLPTEQ